jgi:hypothetical protein
MKVKDYWNYEEGNIWCSGKKNCYCKDCSKLKKKLAKIEENKVKIKKDVGLHERRKLNK